MTKNINIITLGCSKNVVDSEHIMAQFAAKGWKVDFDSDSPEYDVVVINTCGFIGDAKEESIDMILRCAAAKSEGVIKKLYVIGCLSERYAEELRNEIPEVDSYFGARTIDDVVKELEDEWNGDLSTHRVLTTPSHYAYLKISEGCNWGCAYCAIPLIRGKHVSVPMEALEQEAALLAKQGVKELMIIAQDTTYYGIDLYGERKLAELFERLCKIDGIEWIRLHYAYPTAFPDDVIEVMAREPKICKYLDIPLQHISDNQLKSMRRGISKAQSYELIGKLRGAMPDIAIRTTMLVGFPGETDQDFDELMEFVKDVGFDRLGVFAYSEEEGTYSAEKLSDDVSEEVKEARVDAVMQLQSQISLENNLKRVGRIEKIVIDRKEGDFYVGRSQYDSPEVDQEILVDTEEKIAPGDFVDVEIIGAEEYDLYAKLI